MSQHDLQTSFDLGVPKIILEPSSSPEQRYQSCFRLDELTGQLVLDEAIKLASIYESKDIISDRLPLLQGLMIQLDQQIMSESNLFSWGWNGYSRNPHQTHRQFIISALRDIYYPLGIKQGEQPGTTIYPAVCAASIETLNLLKTFNQVKDELKLHLSFLNKFKYKLQELRNGELNTLQRRMGEQALNELGIGQIHKTKLYRKINYTELPLHKVGMFWGTSPKIESVTPEEAIKLACERLSYNEGKEIVRDKLETLRSDNKVAYISLVEGASVEPNKSKELVPFRRTAPRLNYHYYTQPEADQISRSISHQQTAVMPFFYLHRQDVEIDVTTLADEMVVGARSSRGHQYLEDKPFICGANFKIYKYRVQRKDRSS